MFFSLNAKVRKNVRSVIKPIKTKESEKRVTLRRSADDTVLGVSRYLGIRFTSSFYKSSEAGLFEKEANMQQGQKRNAPKQFTDDTMHNIS